MELRSDNKQTDGEMTYKIAQLFALIDENDLAIKYLQKALNEGFFPAQYWLKDPAMTKIISTAEFKSLYNQAQKRHRAFADKFDLEFEF